MKGIFYGMNGNICRKWTRRQAVILTNEAKKGKISRVIQAQLGEEECRRGGRRHCSEVKKQGAERATRAKSRDYVSEGSAADG